MSNFIQLLEEKDRFSFKMEILRKIIKLANYVHTFCIYIQVTKMIKINVNFVAEIIVFYIQSFSSIVSFFTSELNRFLLLRLYLVLLNKCGIIWMVLPWQWQDYHHWWQWQGKMSRNSPSFFLLFSTAKKKRKRGK